MLNLDRLNGLSYQKGCYPGQEIIARLHYRGEVKKRIQLIRSGHTLSSGAAVYHNQTDIVGTIINSASDADGNNYALAVLILEYLNTPLFLDVDNKQSVEIINLPYAIES